MTLKIGLMGFGRIGRNIFRIASKRNDVRFGGISDIADHQGLAYLLRYDSIYGRFDEPVNLENGYLNVRSQNIKMMDGREPGDVPWGELGVDIVIEATARYRSRGELQKHLDAGAKRVVVCVPPKDDLDLTLVCGVNEDELRSDHKIVSVGSCTANAAAPLLKVVHENFGIRSVFLSAIHAYTNDQRVADVPHNDLRRSRAAAENIIPTESHAAVTIAKAYPVLEGKISATALKVPVADGSLADITLELEKAVSVDEINAVVYKACLGPLRGILQYSTDPIVSRDIVGLPYSGIYDSLGAMSMDSGFVKLLTWYDIGWGYAHRVLEVCERLAQLDLEGAP
jgi:glyceraldehyde 3-phosphate dehydrogenase